MTTVRHDPRQAEAHAHIRAHRHMPTERTQSAIFRYISVLYSLGSISLLHMTLFLLQVAKRPRAKNFAENGSPYGRRQQHQYGTNGRHQQLKQQLVQLQLPSSSPTLAADLCRRSARCRWRRRRLKPRCHGRRASADAPRPRQACLALLKTILFGWRR